jgi:hypothetical protein
MAAGGRSMVCGIEIRRCGRTLLQYLYVDLIVPIRYRAKEREEGHVGARRLVKLHARLVFTETIRISRHVLATSMVIDVRPHG